MPASRSNTWRASISEPCRSPSGISAKAVSSACERHSQEGTVSSSTRFSRDGTPAYHPTVTADKAAALHVVYAVLAALLHRERTGGEGQLVEMPMFEAMAAFSLNEHLMGASFEDDGATGYHRTLSPNRRIPR